MVSASACSTAVRTRSLGSATAATSSLPDTFSTTLVWRTLLAAPGEEKARREGREGWGELTKRSPSPLPPPPFTTKQELRPPPLPSPPCRPLTEGELRRPPASRQGPPSQAGVLLQDLAAGKYRDLTDALVVIVDVSEGGDQWSE